MSSSPIVKVEGFSEVHSQEFGKTFNQLAHMEPGGCLYCDEVDESSPVVVEDTFEYFIEALYREENDSLVVEGGLESLFDTEVDAKDSTETECCICYESIDKTKNNCTTECGHTFCLKCLMTSMMHDNFACPCCRADLVDLPKEEDDEEEEEDDGDDDETLDSDDEDEESGCDIVELSRRLESGGFQMQDVLSMLLGRYVKGMTDANVFELNKKFDTIIDDSDNEALEMEAMGMEDLRTIALVV